MEAIDKISDFQRFGSKLGLERMNVIMEKLGNPQNNLKVIHVAGTNGKGSICKYVYEVLQAAGYKCGLYTSPFLEVFNERIQYDGSYISDDDLKAYTERVLEKCEEITDNGGESPTEFEVITAIAFLYFSEKHCDYVVLEVGLGGRGDSTNIVCNPLVSIIASISLDHTDRLGNTIEEIAREKAGIIKRGCPVVSSADDERAKAVFRKRCSELGCSFFDTSQLAYVIESQTLEGCRFTCEIMGKNMEIEISMVGEHQVSNALAALAALEVMEENGQVSLSGNAVKDGFKKAKQIGRFEVLREEPYVIIDGAHNPAGAKALKEAVKHSFEGKRILMVTGILADKDVDQILDQFTDITEEFVITEPDNPRKMDGDILAGKIYAKGGKCTIIKRAREAVNYAVDNEKKYDLILFTGSLYLIGEIRGLLRDAYEEREGYTFL